MRRLTDRFGRAARGCVSLGDLQALVIEPARDLGFDYVALLHHASLAPSSEPFVRIDNYPAGWAAELAANGLWRQDPVHLASRRTNTIFDWRSLGRLIDVTPDQNWILRRSRAFGIGPGVTVPANVPGEPGGSCSFAVRRGGRLPRDRLDAIEVVGVHAFAAARRLADWPRARTRPHLSRREVQCLKLVAAGKTDGECAIILGLSVETVRTYIKRVRSAYDAVSRAQAVALGLRDDWLSFDDIRDSRFV